jgi:ribosomal-protein-alanine N-acetyltransferase
LAGIPRSRKYVVAIDENEIVGYGGIALAGDVADIHTLTVTPKFRRQGIATELLQQLEEWASAQGITTFMLEMREGNSEAQPLYEKHGYEVISKRDNYYSRGIHALIMRKEAGK